MARKIKVSEFCTAFEEFLSTKKDLGCTVGVHEDEYYGSGVIVRLGSNKYGERDVETWLEEFKAEVPEYKARHIEVCSLRESVKKAQFELDKCIEFTLTVVSCGGYM